MSENDRDLRQLADSLKAMPPRELPGDFTDRVVASVLRDRDIPAQREGALQRLLGFLILPRTVKLRPICQLSWAVGLCLVCSLATMWGVRRLSGPAGGERDVRVRFAVEAQEADQVCLVGDFNSWGARQIRLRNTEGGGAWQVVVPLKPGICQYMFVVDGEEWMADPREHERVDDGFGRQNSLIRVWDMDTERQI